ncbi:alpha/beta fold hydrolase [Nocardiopsis sp. N85]|uniref:thioesterase II family protein n=1 Tax=Nocardiopsis sp. N85 TaxID=3029400 RepID=UPI00237FAAF6|nr:alpha/beta fold hydrolase [Nocardiopsis sp. N85]MDE3724211.1 alpha/beta fold hydrolase [Nocardiopsis sp. N85]
MRRETLIRIRPVPEKGFRLFVLHHAGGSAQAYRPWVRHLPPDWDVCLLQAPGRDGTDAPLRDGRALAEFLYPHVTAEHDRPFGLFGHSMGALVAYEIALLAAAGEGPAPAWLGMSAWSPEPGPERDEPRHLLPDERLRRGLARMGGTSSGVLDDPDRWRAAAPLIRADLELVDTWRPRAGIPPLRVPVSVFAGADDIGMPPERMDAWRDHVDGPLVRHTLTGGHFYFVGRIADVAARITADVRAAVGAGV